MVKKFFLILSLTFSSFIVKAGPKNIKVIFLSRSDATSFLFKTINQNLYPVLSKAITQNDFGDVECIPYGEGCFHPQLGYIEDEDKKKKLEKQPRETVGNDDVKTINADDVNLIDCEKKYYFDMYCGKASKGKAVKESSPQYQLWIDISSSMKQVDFSRDEGFCERRRIVAKLEDHCKGKLDVFTFNTSRQHAGGLENTCLNYGTNNGRKLAHWLETTEAKNVVIVTDVDEYEGPFREYLDKVGAEIIGIGVKPLYASDLDGLFDSMKTVCQ